MDVCGSGRGGGLARGKWDRRCVWLWEGGLVRGKGEGRYAAVQRWTWDCPCKRTADGHQGQTQLKHTSTHVLNIHEQSVYGAPIGAWMNGVLVVLHSNTTIWRHLALHTSFPSPIIYLWPQCLYYPWGAGSCTVGTQHLACPPGWCVSQPGSPPREAAGCGVSDDESWPCVLVALSRSAVGSYEITGNHGNVTTQ